MRAKILTLAFALAAATPVFAKTEKAVEPDHSGPIPYSDLAAADAKLNGTGAAPKKHHAVHHAKAAAAPAAAGAPAAPSK